MNKTLLFLVITFFAVPGIHAQGTLKTAMKSIKSGASYDTVVYYGADFSRVRVNDAPKIPRSAEYSKVYPSAWIAFLEKELPPDGLVRHALGFRTFMYRQQEIFDQSVAPNPNLIVGFENSIPPDTLAAMVAGYSLQSKSGLGLVLIPETFSKPSETATTWAVFFDIRSRHIVYMTKFHGKCDHMGYTAHWGSGVVEGFTSFLKH